MICIYRLFCTLLSKFIHFLFFCSVFFFYGLSHICGIFDYIYSSGDSICFLFTRPCAFLLLLSLVCYLMCAPVLHLDFNEFVYFYASVPLSYCNLSSLIVLFCALLSLVSQFIFPCSVLFLVCFYCPWLLIFLRWPICLSCCADLLCRLWLLLWDLHKNITQAEFLPLLQAISTTFYRHAVHFTL